ncbi:DsbE family thiol:disulfide interchange protein [Sphingomonas oleivorans]|uniref:DsbE family thiol:disulfide interchange protein n=1 Tax=Sphingomonas oleivorans TaxID=1735121 RepID=A0A2T5FWH4_9SPHN|nr:DsbE family thiol:disulfide interchange protein [Sphingomonas oleivorans]PTQ10126.1 DsbE family thiol:disulfide interchange protein [Sphingomonas oleivorans]
MKRAIIWAPLLVFAIFVAMFAFGLNRSPEQVISSRLVGQKLPDFALPGALPGQPGLASADLAKGKPRLLNIFASWCVPCVAEAPQLMALKQAGVQIDAIAIRDRPEDVANFLKRWGNPYARIGGDKQSRVQIALGSSGVPESFIIDGRGVIRHQHIGDIRPEDVPAIIAALEAAR